ncbi:MAG: UDP-glucose/GDP-mannose dehydrogenase family protein [Bdellovibrionales bacterium]|nr:UDP-glucose/GDP-mannose dehydrogenase family protein [Bdellovibrionales bacterium]
MNITIVGTGYVGLVAGACFADSGNDVFCIDKDVSKISQLENGEIPIYEPGLKDIVARNAKNGRLRFSTDIKAGVEFGEVIFIAVGTPQDEDGSADLSYVLGVADDIGRHINAPKVIVDKSTVPVGTAKLVAERIARHTDISFEVVSNPEFLKEGAAIDDFMRPDRVVVGVPSEAAATVMKELYAPFVRTNNPILVMDVASAEMTKYAANAMLATRISFMNEIANLCERVGANVDHVRIGIGTDKRIGMSFLFPGIGYGGSCFPKDVQALIRTARDHDVPLLIGEAVEAVNRAQKNALVRKVISHFGGSSKLAGKTFGIWGLAFKPRTDDTREAPALTVCEEILKCGGALRLYDPEAIETFKHRFGEHETVTYASSNYDAVKEVDALLICTEWNDFRHPNFSKLKELMKKPIIFDGRNLFSLDEMRRNGFEYFSIGRPKVSFG